MRLAVLVSAAVLLSGCLFQNVSSGEILRDAVTELNDSTRWGRMDSAIAHVHPAYRRNFAREHRRWSSQIQIADVELMGIEMAQNEDRADITVGLSWYSYETMELRQTIVRQRWRRAGGGYVLRSEEVLGGDPSLLGREARADEPGEPQTSGS